MSDPTGLVQEASTPGTPLYGILGWRSDSIMLARLRPVFMDLMVAALERVCLNDGVSVDPCRTLSLPRTDWCDPCILHDLAERVRAVTRA